MINANELRIGNWLENFIGEYFQANIETLNILSKDSFSEFPHPKPIVLSTSILERCGFEKDSEWIDLWHKKTENATVSIWWYDDGKVMLHNTTPTNHTAYRYVHQLMNLYFALTQTELNITL